jgi:hypothetical protein
MLRSLRVSCRTVRRPGSAGTRSAHAPRPASTTSAQSTASRGGCSPQGGHGGHFHQRRPARERSTSRRHLRRAQAALGVDAAQLEHGLQRHACEFAAAEHAVAAQAGGHGDVALLHAGVGASLDEVEAAHRGQAHQLVHGAFASRTTPPGAVRTSSGIPPVLGGGAAQARTCAYRQCPVGIPSSKCFPSLSAGHRSQPAGWCR